MCVTGTHSCLQALVRGCVHVCMAACVYVCIDVCKPMYVGGWDWCVHHCEAYLEQNLLEAVMVHQIKQQKPN